MRDLLGQITFDVIKKRGQATKTEIKRDVYRFAAKNNLLTEDFVVAFGDIGWVFQNLRQKMKTVKVTKVEKNWIWEIA